MNGHDHKTIEYLENLAATLMDIPTEFGTDQGDVDELHEVFAN